VAVGAIRVVYLHRIHREVENFILAIPRLTTGSNDQQSLASTSTTAPPLSFVVQVQKAEVLLPKSSFTSSFVKLSVPELCIMNRRNKDEELILFDLAHGTLTSQMETETVESVLWKDLSATVEYERPLSKTGTSKVSH
jgi:hypothetical protein